MRRVSAHLAVASILPLAIGSAYAADPSTSAKASIPQQDVTADAWKTWVLSSGKEMRLPPPPDAAASASELEEVRNLLAKVDPAMREKIEQWDFWSPSHRWNEMMVDLNTATPLAGSGINRAFTMLNVALHDAMIAAWDSKYAYQRQRPAQVDPSLKTAVPSPSNPSYPCEHSVAAGVASAVIAHLYPSAAEKVNATAEEAMRSRIQAGVSFPSDTKVGFDLGKQVAGRVIEYMKLSGEKPTASIPSGLGIWKGPNNPQGLEDVAWKPFVLTSPNQFRPPPPPAHDSPERAAELAEVKNFKRTPFTNNKAFYWQYGQNGGPGLVYTYVAEIGKRLAEEGAHVSPPRAARAYALTYVAHYEGWIASQDAKFHYWTARPNQFDPGITTVINTPVFPTYPSNAATLGEAPAVVLSYLFPREKQRYEGWSKEWSESRFWAGIHFRSDLTSGTQIGRKVGESVVARAQADGSDK